MNPQLNEWNLPHGTPLPQQAAPAESGKSKLEIFSEIIDMPVEHIKEAVEGMRQASWENIGPATPESPVREWACNRCMVSWDGHILCPYCHEEATHGRAYEQPDSTPEERLNQVFLAAFGANDPAMLDWVAVKFRLKELTAALAERDEARRLLGEAKEYLEHMRLIANGPVPISGATLFKVEEIEYQITNHLNK